MVHKLRSQAWGLEKVAGALAVAALAWVSLAGKLQAEPPPVHYNHAGVLPPGAIGSEQLLRGGPLPGYFQPVEIKAPTGVVISTAADGAFEDPRQAPMLAGMLIGSVYRLQVTNIPLQEGLEVYPTIEVIDRLYPPVGLEWKFPILVEITQEELEMALAGKFVTRVIYLEEPGNALPAAQAADQQSYFEVADGENPLEAADSLGRPMAILRMGGRVPSSDGPDEAFMYGSPPILKLKPEVFRVQQNFDPFAAARVQGKVKQASAAAPLRQPTRLGRKRP